MAEPTFPIDIEEALAVLTLEEKASLLSGLDFWHTKPVMHAKVDIPSVMVTDGPHGLRKQAGSGDGIGLGAAVPATCFPTASALGSTWDTELLRRVGEAIGAETAANDVAVVLGPGINIKRSPLCGRNFEYLSEDPVIAGDLGGALIRGIQSRGVGASLKHFAANNQETDRMRVSAQIDERTLREIYLAGFERAVAHAEPATVMCSYNKINGVYASQNHWLLSKVLREEWGFDGLVVSDWGAVHDRVAALAAGLDLQMPSDGGTSDTKVVASVRAGELDEAVVDDAVRRVLALLNRTLDAVRTKSEYDADAHHGLAREAAAAGCVLLKNDPVDGEPLLPLPGTPDGAHGLAVVGEFARTPRYQGAGSSQMNPTRLDNALDALRDVYGEVPFAPGFTVAGGPDGDDETLAAQAVRLARTAQTVLLFVGLPGPDESEGFDRPHMGLPGNQVELLRRIADVNRRVVVVLANGGAVTLEWRDRAAAILEGWLGGQATGTGLVDVLTGVVNPAGRLAETIPLRIEDTPAWGNFPGEFGQVRYGEGLLVGYRWYDAREAPVAYPFGHGLSYTTFGYDDIRARVSGKGQEATVEVSVRVTNTGTRTGAEVVQVYVGDTAASVARPRRELKAFAKVTLEPGESRTVPFRLTARDLSYWHPVLHRWTLEGGEFVVWVGASSRDLRGNTTIDVSGEDIVLPLHEMSTLGEALAHPVAGPILRERLDDLAGEIEPATMAMMAGIPLADAAQFGFPIQGTVLDRLIAAANAR